MGFLKAFKNCFFLFLLNKTDRFQEKSRKIISLNFQGGNSVDCTLIGFGSIESAVDVGPCLKIKFG